MTYFGNPNDHTFVQPFIGFCWNRYKGFQQVLDSSRTGRKPVIDIDVEYILSDLKIEKIRKIAKINRITKKSTLEQLMYDGAEKPISNKKQIANKNPSREQFLECKKQKDSKYAKYFAIYPHYKSNNENDFSSNRCKRLLRKYVCKDLANLIYDYL